MSIFKFHDPINLTHYSQQFLYNYCIEHHGLPNMYNATDINNTEETVLKTIETHFPKLKEMFGEYAYTKVEETSGINFKMLKHRNTTDGSNYTVYFMLSYGMVDEKRVVTGLIAAFVPITATMDFVKSEADKLFKDINSLRKAPKTNSKINMVIEMGSQFGLKEFKIKKEPINLEENYNDIAEHLPMILKRLNTKGDKGILMLYGDAGGGKTTFIRHLLTKINKTVIYLPPDMAQMISSPKFLPFLMNYPNSVLVIEDSENVIKTRNGGGNQSVSNILNLSDGILADVLNIQIITTFNTSVKQIDSALLRKGRLIYQHEFGKLCIEKAQKLSDKLGFNTTITEPMMLSDIYNQHEADNSQVTKRNKVGF